jgi:hypothetical protein
MGVKATCFLSFSPNGVIACVLCQVEGFESAAAVLDTCGGKCGFCSIQSVPT